MTWYKQASKKGAAPEFETSGRLQEQWQTTLGDYQRSVVDAYTASAHLTETKYKITVSITVNKVHLGTIMFQMFWRYDLNEMSRARKTYNKVKEALKKIFDELSDNEAPSSLYESMIRHDCSKIDSDKIAKTTIPHINWSQNLSYERDWRSTIYGTRYPSPDSHCGF